MTKLLLALVLAVPVGSIYGLAASGLVLTYRTSRVFNFAHGAVGMVSAFVFRELWVEAGLPLGVAFALTALVIAPAAGIIGERILFRPLADAPVSVKVVSTVGLLIALQGIAETIWGGEAAFLPPLFPTKPIRIYGQVHVGTDQIAVFLLGAACTLALGAVLRWTRFGLVVRAVVDNRELAEIAGIRSRVVSSASWAAGFAFAAVAGILLSPIVGLDSFVLTLVVVQAYAAALGGRMSNLPLTFVSGVGLAFVENLIRLLVPQGCGPCRSLVAAVPFLVIFGMLAAGGLFPTSLFGRWIAGAARTERASPPPPERLPSARPLAAAYPVAAVAAVAVIAPTLGGLWLGRLSEAVALTGVFVSLVVLSGLTGQVSLGHTAFVGAGAFFMAGLTTGAGLPWFVALVVAGVAAVPLGILVALPALRLQGLFLALLTFGFALVVDNVFRSFLTQGTTGLAVSRPSIARTDLGYLYVLLAITTVLVLLAWNLERSPTGRVLAAIRDSEEGAQSIGVSLPRYKLAVFSLSSFAAGIAGASFAGLRGLVTAQDFVIFLSLVWLAVTVVAGITSTWGALVAGILWLASSGSRATGQILFGFVAILLARQRLGLLALVWARPWQAVRRFLRASTAGYRGEVSERAVASGR